MSIRAKRKNQTREALLKAVLEQCASGQSFSSLSLRQVTKIAGVVPATFYRHFKDMEDLGRTLVNEELAAVIVDLHNHLGLSNTRGHSEQITTSIDLFFGMVDTYPNYWHFAVTERWGGSPAVTKALKKQLDMMVKILAKDLTKLNAFETINKEDAEMLAEIGSNMFYSWIMGWLELSQTAKKNDLAKKRADYKNRCDKQGKLLFYGAANWQSKPN